MIAINSHPRRQAESRFDRPRGFDPYRSHIPNEDYRRLVGEVTVLRQKKVQIGMAIVLGDIDRRTCAEIKRTIAKLGDYISYANCGLFVVVAFQRCLFEQLKPMWQQLLAGAHGVCAGVAFPGDDTDTHGLVLAAHLALGRAIDSHYDLVAFNEEESTAAVAIHRIGTTWARKTSPTGEVAQVSPNPGSTRKSACRVT